MITLLYFLVLGEEGACASRALPLDTSLPPYVYYLFISQDSAISRLEQWIRKEWSNIGHTLVFLTIVLLFNKQ